MVSLATSVLSWPVAELRRVRLSNGVTLRYAQQGPHSGPAVVMLHGLSDSWFSFSRVLPFMPAGLRVIVPDQRGHGESDQPLSGYGPGDFADDAIRLMDVLQVPTAVVVGHSMGSFVARKIVERAPRRVSRLVLTGAGATADVPAAHDLLRVVNASTDPVDEAFVRDFQMSCVNTPVPPEFMDAVIATSRRMPARIWRAALQGMFDADIRLQRPIVPTLVLGGREDAVFSATEQMALARRFPNGELELVDGVGHTLHWEQPQTFVGALIRFGM